MPVKAITVQTKELQSLILKMDEALKPDIGDDVMCDNMASVRDSLKEFTKDPNRVIELDDDENGKEFDSQSEAKAFAEGIEYVNDSALSVDEIKFNKSKKKWVVTLIDEDAE